MNRHRRKNNTGPQSAVHLHRKASGHSFEVGEVALLDVSAAAGTSLVENLEEKFGKDKTLFIECDVQSEEQLKAAFQKIVETFGKLDIVCNNAGVFDETQWEKTVSINLMGMIRVSYLGLEHMSKLCKGHGGVIINTVSMAGLEPMPYSPVYTASKYGVVGFTRAMAMASLGAEDGVRFNALCPAYVKTNLAHNLPDRMGPYTHMQDMMMELINKLGTMDASKVAEALMELVLDEKKTGEALIVMPHENKYAQFQVLI
ncbi:15-hydroxyprostaglandin dehydrogenase [NAD(+)]-like [Boleophthalmus pectinirostris]|uniref:15-hydroxyprostaglandin dehydrogenase [NAD(+)]-like n=1 Tax=Boleophthalmus pectinirostris TaxID=150288 RepID=UPI00242D748D|nr:15-hydroxyprostaglandin dehydrogenase [NAD(+)]-like [Boleophthalmus pectinirostris]